MMKTETTRHPGVYRRGEAFMYVTELGEQRSQRCSGCGRRTWVEREPALSCRKCSSPLDDARPERRQVWRSKDEAHPDGFKSAKQAADARSAAMGSVKEGTFAAPSSATFGEYLTAWLDGHRGKIRATTYGSYAALVHGRIVPALGGIKLQALTPERLDAFYADLSAGGLANKSVRNIHVLIHRALTDAARRGRVRRNVADLAEPPRLERKVMAVWTAEQMGSFLAHSRQDRWYPLWRLAMTTGMRRGELLGLKWTALDLDAATLTVEQTRVQATGHGAVTSEPKTRAGRRSVNLDPETVTT